MGLKSVVLFSFLFICYFEVHAFGTGGMETIPLVIYPEEVTVAENSNANIPFSLWIEGIVSTCYRLDRVDVRVDDEKGVIAISPWWDRLVGMAPCSSRLPGAPLLRPYRIPVEFELSGSGIYAIEFEGVTFPAAEKMLTRMGFRQPYRMSDFYNRFPNSGQVDNSILVNVED